MNESASRVWNDAVYLASAHVPALSRDARPAWWNPEKVIGIVERMERHPEYSDALASCLSMLRPELFRSGKRSSTSHDGENALSDHEPLCCDHDINGIDEHEHRACCFIRALADAALQDDALRIVVDGRPYRLLHQYGMWFVVGLASGDAHRLVHDQDQVHLVRTSGTNGPLYRIDQDLPRRRIEILAATPWKLEDALVVAARKPDLHRLIKAGSSSMNVTGGRL